MRIVAYTPADFPRLAAVAGDPRVPRGLVHRPFVDWYYASRDWSRLHLALDAEGRVAGAIGVEQIPFEVEGRPVTIGFASNIVALRPGVGGPLFLHWLRTSELACIYGGSEHTHRVIRSLRWTYFHGVRVMRLGGVPPARAGEAWWRRAAKATARTLTPGPNVARRVAGLVGAVRVVEERALAADVLPAAGPFTLRVAPRAEYLAWRYDTTLPFVRYRPFRILHDAAPCGYVVLNDRPERLLVAQADGAEPALLAAGILAAVAHVAGEGRGGRDVLLASAHAGMQAIFRRAGFRAGGTERPFALGSRHGRVGIPPDTAGWLVNLDWTDNGLRAPFLDEAAAGGAARAAR